jgi:hypothetical protein
MLNSKNTVLPSVVVLLALGITPLSAQNTTSKNSTRIAAKPLLLPVNCPNGFIPGDQSEKCVKDMGQVTTKLKVPSSRARATDAGVPTVSVNLRSTGK